MIARIIEFCVRNRAMVIIAWLGVALWGTYAVLHTPVDAIPDLSENQVIVFADWMGRSPQDIEEQITYPLSVQLQGLAGVKAVRSSSEFNFAMINVIFDDKTDFYFARTRVLERLATAQASMPAGVTPYLAPDATALGQIFWYTVEGNGLSLDELRAIQDWTVRYQLNSISGVAEVASVGGFVREYQVDVDPAKLRVYDLPLGTLYAAIANSNMSVGGKVMATPNGEYLLRGVGWLKGVRDLEEVEVASRKGVAVRLKDVATVQLGPEFRRSALEKDGREAVGGVVMMRYGENPLAVTAAIKDKIRQIQSGLPEGVRIVPFYDRTRLIESAIHTVTGTLKEEIIIASLAILLILMHFRSAFVVCITLPLAVLVSFLFMYYLDIPSNIMSLSGIAISIGILVDAAVVMVENATHELHDRFGNQKVRGDTTEVVVKACRLVGRPIFFSVLIMLISFLPIFAFGGQEGKLSHPLAFTKSFAMIGVAVLAVTLVPALIPIFIRGRLRGEMENWIVRSFIDIYKPLLSWMIDRPGVVWWILAIIMVLAAAFIDSHFVSALAVGTGAVFVLLGTRRGKWSLRGAAVLSLILVALLADTRFRKLGGEFMPSLDEGSILDMPTTSPRVTMAQAVDDVTERDRILRTFPEVESAVGKVGRADTSTDPSPIDMIETIITLRPKHLWPKRMLHFDDAQAQAQLILRQLKQRGWIKPPADADESTLLNEATMHVVTEFDRHTRQFIRQKQDEFEPDVHRQLVSLALDELITQIKSLPPHQGHPALSHDLSAEDRQLLIDKAMQHGIPWPLAPRQEQVDELLQTFRREMVDRHWVEDREDLLISNPPAWRVALDWARRSLGGRTSDFSQRVHEKLGDRYDRLWRDRMHQLDWELFDGAVVEINSLLTDGLLRSARHEGYVVQIPDDSAVRDFRGQFDKPLAAKLFLWHKSKQDLLREMDSDLQMPGWGNAWTQPIINRVNMLATGVRTQIGVKVYGPTGKSLEDSVADLQRISNQIATRLRQVPGAVDVVADQATGKSYLEITINRENAARYGVNMSDVAMAVEAAMGGQRITQTIEGRQRFPVRLRYARAYWQDPQAIGDVLVEARTSPADLLVPAKDDKAAGGETPMVQIPLRLVADIRIVEGPAMIKSENGRLRNYVTLNVRDRDIVGFVEEAQQAIRPIEAELAGTGMSIEWSGEFEHQVRARQTMAVIFPMVILAILFLLYVTFREMMDTLLVLLAVVGALCGSVMFQALFNFNFSVIVSIGYVAAFGMATQTGVIMLVYLRDAIDRHGGLEKIESLAELRQAVIEGAVHRLRPKLLTEGVAIVGLVPMLWATGTGAEIMRPMAAPVLGGLLISDEVVDLMIPVLFYRIRRRRWLRMRQEKTVPDAIPAII
jgi:Cu(I)/Ag(I) efflux system membrane protein CusA/SilA